VTTCDSRNTASSRVSCPRAASTSVLSSGCSDAGLDGFPSRCSLFASDCRATHTRPRHNRQRPRSGSGSPFMSAVEDATGAGHVGDPVVLHFLGFARTLDAGRVKVRSGQMFTGGTGRLPGGQRTDPGTYAARQGQPHRHHRRARIASAPEPPTRVQMAPRRQLRTPTATAWASARLSALDFAAPCAACLAA
jgi:hypothetical protein